MNIAKYVLPFLICNSGVAQSYYPTDHTVTCGHDIKYKNKTVSFNSVKEHNVQKFNFLNEGDDLYIVIVFNDNTIKKYILNDNDACSAGNHN